MNIKEPVMLKPGTNESAVLETRAGHLQIAKPKAKYGDHKSEKGSESWKDWKRPYGRHSRRDYSPASSQGRSHSHGLRQVAESPVEGLMPPPLCMPKQEHQPAVDATPPPEMVDRAGGPADQKLPLVLMPATFNYEAWIQWLVAQSNDWNNFAI
eukprot:6484315-Amphidinium_carterae.1